MDHDLEQTCVSAAPFLQVFFPIVVLLATRQFLIMDAGTGTVEDGSTVATAFSQLTSDIASMREHLSQMQ